MPLPTSRNTNHAPGSQVKSDDLNDIQDWIVNLYNGEHALRWRTATILNGRAVGTLTVTLNDNLSVTHTGANGGVYRVPIIVSPGERIVGVRARVTPVAAGVTVGLQRGTDGTVALVGSQSPASSGTGTQTIQRTDLAEDVADNPAILYCLSWFVPASAPGSILLAADFATIGL